MQHKNLGELEELRKAAVDDSAKCPYCGFTGNESAVIHHIRSTVDEDHSEQHMLPEGFTEEMLYEDVKVSDNQGTDSTKNESAEIMERIDQLPDSDSSELKNELELLKNRIETHEKALHKIVDKLEELWS